MSEVEISCSTCRFWEEQSECCHRYAPTPILGNEEQSGERQIAYWASTKAEDWCGDHESPWEEEDDEEAAEYDGEDDEEWASDGTLNWTPPPAAPPGQRGIRR